MSKPYEKSNEALAILAQRGCEVVREKHVTFCSGATRA